MYQGQVQTEEHVLLNCEQTAQLRSEFPCVSNYNTISALLSFNSMYFHDILLQGA